MPPFYPTTRRESGNGHSSDASDSHHPAVASTEIENASPLAAKVKHLRQQVVTQTHLMHLLTHQLATPLTALQGSVQLLSEPSLSPEQRQEFLAMVQQQVLRLQGLLNNLMNLRQLETGALAPQPTAFAVTSLVEELLSEFPSHPIACLWNSPLPLVWADRWQVGQVMVNLLSNAIKYSPSGSPIQVGAQLRDLHWLEVWVRDWGLGIPAADQARLFERFYRVQHGDRQHIQGNGLGLSLCQLLVEKHGGNASL
ncbi:hypothetical protein DO97_14275 [Neosynechococcus sphagnicola sy1]|uniref:histidine kinase n=1 Tax=Neosynechococcus sphagnicola sy1 TaxID=1497020 RepID=A0A098TM58_9CYAN|nr:ATP-binding protein [Neosynechococcus sphagnicola]KGF71923.1 hypothetical protein DO97_14275 [Neosynechococcus sphagnicola sy1]